MNSSAQASCGLRAGDELWIVSTRQLPCAAHFAPVVRRYDAKQGWTASDLSTLNSAPVMPTVIDVHGNRMSYSDAVQTGWQTYHALSRDEVAPPMRFIIWTWPSDRIHGQLLDVRVKAYRADQEGYYLAQGIASLDSAQSIGLIGYSYGSRVIASALHQLGGGTLPGVEPTVLPLAEDGSPKQLPPLHAVMMAPAMNRNVLGPGQRFSHAMLVLDHLLVLYNPCDPVLRHYRLVERRPNVRAMGSAGVGLVADGRALEQLDVSGRIGRTHHINTYLRSHGIMVAVRDSVLFTPDS